MAQINIWIYSTKNNHLLKICTKKTRSEADFKKFANVFQFKDFSVLISC